MIDEKEIRAMAERIEADLFAAICGPIRKQPQTALRVTGSGHIETITLDDDGKIIEPCRACGPILLCSKHAAMVT